MKIENMSPNSRACDINRKYVGIQQKYYFYGTARFVRLAGCSPWKLIEH